jgi:hypothetical protein
MSNEQQGTEVVGDLTQEEQRQLEDLRKHAQQVTQRVGMLEAEKFRLLMAGAQVEQHVQGVLQSVGARLAIPQGTAWHVVGNKVVIVQHADPPENPSKE